MRRFYFRLALALGMTVRELLSRIESRELSEWTAYFQMEPFGQDRQDVGAAIVAATIANIWRSEGDETYQPADFMPDFEKKSEEPQPWREQLAIAEMLNEAFGGKDLRNR